MLDTINTEVRLFGNAVRWVESQIVLGIPVTQADRDRIQKCKEMTIKRLTFRDPTEVHPEVYFRLQEAKEFVQLDDPGNAEAKVREALTLHEVNDYYGREVNLTQPAVDAI